MSANLETVTTQAVAARLGEIAQHFEVMAGSKRMHEFNGREIGLTIGFKDSFFETADIKEAPGLIATAIRKGRGKLFARVEAAVRAGVLERLSEHRQNVAARAVETRRQLASWMDSKEEGAAFAGRRLALVVNGQTPTQAELAELMGVARNTVTRWENGGVRIQPWAWKLLSYIERDFAGVQ